MKVNSIPYRPIWPSADGTAVEIIDQRVLPHSFETCRLMTCADAVHAIQAMLVRGAPLIGVTAAYGLWLALREEASDAALAQAAARLRATRPTAVNLQWALDDIQVCVKPLAPADRADAAFRRAGELCEADVAMNAAIGHHGLEVLKQIYAAKRDGGSLNILTHCNAGWLATVDWGTAIAPIYMAYDTGIPVRVWVDETRPRNQGAALTAWELSQHGVPNRVIVDNAGGLLMARGEVDLCITGTDRTTASGDVCNKIGTYLKALAARDNGVPFYVALPGPTIDWSLSNGADIPIEERDSREVTYIAGQTDEGAPAAVRITPPGAAVANYGFDITPARLVTGLITERGLCEASASGLAGLYPDKAADKTTTP